MEERDEEDLIQDTDMDSFIEIEMYQNNAYTAGTPLYGTIHLYCKADIPDVK